MVRSWAVIAAAVLGLGSSAWAAEGDTLFPAGTRTLSLDASVAVDTYSDTFASLTAGAGYYVIDNFAFLPQISARFIDTDENETVGGDFSLLMRAHLITRGKWTFFVDAGAGVGYFDHNFTPPDGTHFNFVLQGGPGFTYKLEENLHLVGGARYLHLSNGGIKGADRHTGSNGVLCYVGLMWTF